MKHFTCIGIFSILISNSAAQNVGVGTSTPNASAQLDITAADKGLLIPRVALTSSADAITIASPAASLLVYNTGSGGLGPAGYYYNSGTAGAPAWVQLVTPGSVWSLTGNAGTADGTHFMGTTDNVPLSFRVNNQPAGKISTAPVSNTFLGAAAGASATTGTSNTAIGTGSLFTNLAKNKNTAIGVSAMAFADNSPGNADTYNTAVGYSALSGSLVPANNTGTYNTALGALSMINATSGSYNLASGSYALQNNTTGNSNTALGAFSMVFNIAKNKNTAVGTFAMRNANPDGTNEDAHNTAVGYAALYGSLVPANNTGTHNTTMGSNSLTNNTSGSENTASGSQALSINSTGSSNTALGAYTLETNQGKNGSTAVGAEAMRYANSDVTASTTNNTALGYAALRGSSTAANNTGINNTAIGSQVMFSITSGNNNSALGGFSLTNIVTASNNTALGLYAMETNLAKNDNTAIGAFAMRYVNSSLTNTSTANTAVGFSALRGSVAHASNTGTGNTGVGFQSLFNNTSGTSNTALGSNTLAANTTGINNTAVGYEALGQNVSGDGSVALGYRAGSTETTSNKLYIENSNANKDNALIYGDFSADSLALNAKTIVRDKLAVKQSGDLTGIEIGYLTAKQADAGKIQYGGFGGGAHVVNIVGGGSVAGAGSDRIIKLWSEGGLQVRGNALPDANNTYTLGTSALRWKEVWTNAATINSSDARLKTNIQPAGYGLKEVMQLRPVQYNWKTNPSADRQIGFLAQDVLKLVPEVVVVPANGDPLGMKYTELIPVLVKAIQEQQKMIEALQNERRK